MRPSGRRKDREEEHQTLYGLRPVLEALRAGRRRVHGVWALEGRADRPIREIAETAGRLGVPVVREGRAWLTERAGSPDHQGVVARAGPLPWIALEELARNPAGERAAVPGTGEGACDVLLVLDGIEDPRNFGALCRSALALGCRGAVFQKDRAAGVSPAAAKAAAGALERLPLARVTNLAAALELLKRRGYWIIGLAEDADRLPGEVWADGPVAVVVGSEGRGLRRLVRERCDQVMRIATSAAFPTLNASVAGAIALHETLRRQRSGEGRPPK